MTAMRISFATENQYVFEAAQEAFRIDRNNRKDAPPVIIDCVPTELHSCTNIGPTIVATKRRADHARRRNDASLGVAFGYGRSEFVSFSRPGKVSLIFVVVMAVDEKGAIVYGIPDIYPTELRSDIKKRADEAFAKLSHRNVSNDVLIAATLSVGAWANLQFDDPQVELNLYN